MSKPNRRHKPRFDDTLQPQHGEIVSDLLDAIPDLGFKSDYLRKEMLSKFLDPKLVTPSVRHQAGVAKWRTAERQNRKTNQRLQLYAEDTDFGWTTSSALFKLIRSFVSDALGPLSYPAVLSGSAFTNGASTRIRRGVTASIQKFGGDIELSESAVKHWLACHSGTLLSDQNLRLVESSILFTVSKTTDIDRVACKEPEGNALLQRAVGLHIASRLKRFRIDLSDQTRNQRLARRASIRENGLATIDLSSASDTITRQLVIELLPFEWWSLLDDLRVKSARVNGELHELEMFSSMGNGFTFELESLLFWCITRAVCALSQVRGTVSVYGDDIVAPSRVVPRLQRIFSFLGFTMNMKKTNWRGDFRESCGKHYYRGLDVSPFYIREKIRKRSHLVHILNQVLEWSGRGWGFFLDEELAVFHQKYSAFIPQTLWGGVDTSDPHALVTGHMPRKRLSIQKRTVSFDPSLGLRAWLHTRECSDAHLQFVPALSVGFKLESNRSLGAVTSWRPYLVYPSK